MTPLYSKVYTKHKINDIIMNKKISACLFVTNRRYFTIFF